MILRNVFRVRPFLSPDLSLARPSAAAAVLKSRTGRLHLLGTSHAAVAAAGGLEEAAGGGERRRVTGWTILLRHVRPSDGQSRMVQRRGRLQEMPAAAPLQ